MRNPLDSFPGEPAPATLDADVAGAPSLAVGERFDRRFIVSALLGRGGAGAVYEVTAEAPPRRYALKVVHFAPDSGLRRLRREGAILSRLRGEHFVRVHETGVAPPWGYVLMDRLEGEDLATLLDRQRRLSIAAVLDLSRQLSSALDCAHELGYVHRDIKPTNLFLECVDAGSQLKLLDFGIAKHFAEQARLTVSGTLLGAPAYMAPEQIENPRTVDARADLWSYAVVLYRCLVGQRPFAGVGGELLQAVLEAPPELPSALRSDLPRSIDGFFVRALAKRRDERFSSASELHAALERALR